MVKKNKFGIIGAGVVGVSLAVLLQKAGLECVGVNTRSTQSYERFRGYLDKEYLTIQQLALVADLIFITTQDAYIEDTAAILSQANTRKTEQVWIHCSGSLPAMSLCKDPELNVEYLSLHPLQSFATIENALILMEGTYFGIEGSSRESESLGEELVTLLGGTALRIDPEKKTLYHAGAVAASNYLVALSYLAVKLFKQAGIKEQDALNALLPLMAGSLRNIERIGLPGALTGPIARGDVQVVAKHLQSMPEEERVAYKALGRLAMQLGIAKYKDANQADLMPMKTDDIKKMDENYKQMEKLLKTELDQLEREDRQC